MVQFDTAWWVKNGKRWHQEFAGGPAYDAQEAALVEVLRTLTGVESILEVGSGAGRITRYLAEEFPHADLLATDLRGVNRFDLDAPTEAPISDLVVAAEVLMHRPPENVSSDIALLCWTAARYVLTVDWCEDSNRQAEGCYQHDYPALFGRYGIVTETPVPAARQSVFLTRITEVKDGADS